MPTYDEVYAEDRGKRRHYTRLLNGAKSNSEGVCMWCVVIGALLFLWFLRRGFRGVSAGGLVVGR